MLCICETFTCPFRMLTLLSLRYALSLSLASSFVAKWKKAIDKCAE